MHRFIKTAALGLLWLGPHAIAGGKPAPPSISACYGEICLLNLRWVPPSSLGDKPMTTIEGSFVNRTAATLSSVSLTFPLISGTTLFGTAHANYLGEIPPGQRWFFVASFVAQDGRFVITKAQSVQLNCVARTSEGLGRVLTTLHFDPLFSPLARGERNAWEKIHGKRER
jgi:hypothetical protein